MEEEIRTDSVDLSMHQDSLDPSRRQEAFAEVSLFGAEMAGSDESGDCSCFSCDGNPCVR